LKYILALETGDIQGVTMIYTRVVSELSAMISSPAPEKNTKT